MTHDKGVQFMGQGKDHMIILYRQQFAPSGLQPLFLFQSAAIGTMPVAATMILILPAITVLLITAVEMIAQDRSAADTQAT